MKPLETEYDFYLSIHQELVSEHDGKLVAIKGQEVLGIFEDYRQAANTIYVEHEYGTVLMQEIGRDHEFFTGIYPAPEVESH